jgi:hypothetical protein
MNVDLAKLAVLLLQTRTDEIIGNGACSSTRPATAIMAYSNVGDWAYGGGGGG